MFHLFNIDSSCTRRVACSSRERLKPIGRCVRSFGHGKYFESNLSKACKQCTFLDVEREHIGFVPNNRQSHAMATVVDKNTLGVNKQSSQCCPRHLPSRSGRYVSATTSEL